MAELDNEKAAPPENVTSPAHSMEGETVDIPSGWMYKSPKVLGVRLPWYASPQSQLLLVAFVCFLCPGKCKEENGEKKLMVTTYRS